MKILITYASAHGSTAEIAERIATRLRARGSEVDAIAVENAPRVEEFDAVVVGSAIHDGAWLPSAATFMTKNARTLATRPTWLFSVGMVDALPRFFRKWAKVEGPKVVAPFSASIRPRGIELFSGVIREEHLPWLGRALFRLLGGHFGDYRNWAAIDAWADALVDDLALSHAAA
jgi:menaquinone-dependent protoporphyrinogen oxidase